TSSIHLDGKNGVKTVSQVIESPAWRGEYSQRLEAAGVRLLSTGDIFLATKLVSGQLLRGSAWEGQKIDQLLLRLPNVVRALKRIGGRPVRGLIIPGELAEIGGEDDLNG